MENNRFFFVNVCRRSVCAVYFVIVPMATIYLKHIYISSFAVYKYQYVIVTLDVDKWT